MYNPKYQNRNNQNQNSNYNRPYFDKNYLTLQGNVANKKPIQVYKTKKTGKPFAFITIGSNAGNRTTYVECQAWGQRAYNLTQFHQGNKLYIKAHLTNGYDTTQNGDTVRTIVPVITSAKRMVFAKHARGQTAQRPMTNRQQPARNMQRPNPINNGMPSDLGGGQPVSNPLNNAPANNRKQKPSNHRKPTKRPAGKAKNKPMSDDDFASLTNPNNVNANSKPADQGDDLPY